MPNLMTLTGNRRELIEALRCYSKRPTLSQFIKDTGYTLQDIYKTDTFYGLCQAAGLMESEMDALASVMKKAFQRLTFIDSKVWIEFLLECLNGKAVELDRDGMDMLNMLLYTVYQIPEISSLELLERIKASEEIKNELIALLEYR